MAERDQGLSKEALDQDSLTASHSFDELAKGIAAGTLSRGQVLKLVGAAALGSVLSGALPGVAVAKKRKKKKKKKKPTTITTLPTGQTCDSSNCANGCCVNNTCHTNDPQFCGTGGGNCLRCADNVACVSGSCQAGSSPPCSASNCPNGCCENNTCHEGDPAACGTGGGNCHACGTGTACVNGSCICNPSTCAGCCSGGFCLAQTTPDFCGTGGGLCTTCAPGEDCCGGTCAPLNTPENCGACGSTCPVTCSCQQTKEGSFFCSKTSCSARLCTSDTDCHVGEVCSGSGRCSCTASSECDVGKRCLSSNSLCFPSCGSPATIC